MTIILNESISFNVINHNIHNPPYQLVLKQEKGLHESVPNLVVTYVTEIKFHIVYGRSYGRNFSSSTAVY